MNIRSPWLQSPRYPSIYMNAIDMATGQNVSATLISSPTIHPNVSSYLNILESKWPYPLSISSPQYRLRNAINGLGPNSEELNDIFSEIAYDINKIDSYLSLAITKLYFKQGG